MDKITTDSIANSKPSFVVAVEAAATLTIGAGELGIFMGDNVKGVNNQRVVTAFENLRDRLREANFPVGPGAVTFVTGTPPSSEGYTVGEGAAIPALTEDDAVIAYGNTFYPAGNSSNYLNMINRLMERFQEDLLPFD
ncbi:MAG: hypothetical protein KAS38_18180 [Anaerolineales bacterium]|nr:hypothetical protein [Anaerolineales bacterium]